MATNYLGAFYLTHLLAKQLIDTPHSRMVQLTSLVEPNGGIEWSDIGCAFLESAAKSAAHWQAVIQHSMNRDKALATY